MAKELWRCCGEDCPVFSVKQDCCELRIDAGVLWPNRHMVPRRDKIYILCIVNKYKEQAWHRVRQERINTKRRDTKSAVRKIIRRGKDEKMA